MAGTRIAVALFTNFTRDHLDYHGDMAAYWAEKRRLFGWDGLKSAVINVDDPQGAKLVAELAGSGWTCGPSRPRARPASRPAKWATPPRACASCWPRPAASRTCRCRPA
jgi:UDP-N-acetylmuramyl tripeptide synthase